MPPAKNSTSSHGISWRGGSRILSGAGLWNTGLFALGAVTGQMLLGFSLALLVSKVSRARVLYRTIFILPILIPGIVIGAIWKLRHHGWRQPAARSTAVMPRICAAYWLVGIQTDWHRGLLQGG